MFYLMQNIQSDRIEEILHDDPEDGALASHGHPGIHGRGGSQQRQVPGLHGIHGLQSRLGPLQNQTCC